MTDYMPAQGTPARKAWAIANGLCTAPVPDAVFRPWLCERPVKNPGDELCSRHAGAAKAAATRAEKKAS